MSKEENKIVPALRFPEFVENWNIKILSKCADVIDPHPSHRAPDSVREGIPFIGIGDISESGVLDKKNVRIVSNEIYTEHSDRYQLRVGDFAFGRVASVGKVVDLSKNIDKIYTYSPTMAIIQPKSINATFIRFFCGSNFFIIQVNSKTSGSTRKSIGMQNLRILEILVPPNPKEQQKIAACLSSLDEVITAETEKLDLLQDHKKGLLQQLFPAEGDVTLSGVEGQPKFRFPEFKEDGDWEETEIAELFKFKQGVQVPVDNQYPIKEDGMVRFIRIIDITGNSEPPRYIVNPGKDHIITKEDLFMIRYGTPGAISLGFDGVIANNLFRLIWKSNYSLNSLFWFYAFQKIEKKIFSLSGSSSMPAISFSTLNNLGITYPKKAKEQQKIAACLSAADALIEAQTQKIEALQEHKKGLLQQLFPTMSAL